MKDSRKPGNLWTRALFLVIAGGLTGLLVNALRPAGGIELFYPWSMRVEARAMAEDIPLISLEQVREATETGSHMLIDARIDTEYQSGTIPGSLSAPLSRIDEAFLELAMFVIPEDQLITFCSGPDCDEALMLALYLRDQGMENVSLFVGGIEEWLAADLPLEGAP